MTPKHRLFVRPDQIAGDTLTLDAAQAHQLARVLRLRPGDALLVLDGTDRQTEARIAALDARAGLLRLNSWRPAPPEPACRLTLYQALIKQDRFEWVVQKGTEIGVAAFVPVVTERAVVREVSPAKLTRWRAIAREAAEQSGRGRLPDIHNPVSLTDLPAGNAPLAVCWEAETSTLLRHLLPRLGRPGNSAGVLIGPEGGLTIAEVDQLRGRGALVAGLGPRILRAETAGPVAAALILHAAGDLG